MADDAAVVVTLRANLKDYEAALKTAVRQTERAAQAAEKAVSGIAKNARGPGNVIAADFSKSAQQIQNDARILQFQLNDVFSGLASGQGIRALQVQLGQIAQQMSGGGLAQGARTMGAAMIGMINPINLAVVAFGLLATAAASYFGDSEDGAKETAKALDEQLQHINALIDAFGKLNPALKEQLDVRKALLEVAKEEALRAQEIKGQYNKAAEEIKAAYEQLAQFGAQAMESGDPAAFKEFFDALANLETKLKDNTATAADVERAFKALVNTGVEGAAALANELRNKTLSALKDIETQAKASGNAIANAINAMVPLGQMGALPPLSSAGGQFLNPDQMQTFRAGQAAISDMNKELEKSVQLIRRYEGGLVAVAKQQEPGGAFRAGYSSDTITDPATGAFRAVRPGDVVNKAQADADLLRRIRDSREFVARQLGQEVLASLSADQQAVLDSLVYNYGKDLKDLGPVFAQIRKGELDAAAKTIATMATGPHFPKVLRDRRQDEARIFAGSSEIAQGALKQLETQQAAIQSLADWNVATERRIELEKQVADINAQVWVSEAQRTAQVEALRMAEEQLHALRQAGVPVTAEMEAGIRRQAEALAQVTVKSQEAAAAQAAANKAAKENAASIQQLTQTLAGLAVQGITGFVQDLRNGVDAATALYNMVSRIADQLLQMALQRMFMSILGGFQGGGFVPGLGGGLYASGGYTGPGPTDKPAGIVHAGEFVINAAATQRHRDLLEAINRGYASGGFVLPNIRSLLHAPAADRAAMVGQSGGARTTVVNTFDAGSFLSEALSRPDGVNVILNAVRAQPGAFRTALGS